MVNMSDELGLTVGLENDQDPVDPYDVNEADLFKSKNARISKVTAPIRDGVGEAFFSRPASERFPEPIETEDSGGEKESEEVNKQATNKSKRKKKDLSKKDKHAEVVQTIPKPKPVSASQEPEVEVYTDGGVEIPEEGVVEMSGGARIISGAKSVRVGFILYGGEGKAYEVYCNEKIKSSSWEKFSVKIDSSYEPLVRDGRFVAFAKYYDDVWEGDLEEVVWDSSSKESSKQQSSVESNDSVGSMTKDDLVELIVKTQQAMQVSKVPLDRKENPVNEEPSSEDSYGRGLPASGSSGGTQEGGVEVDEFEFITKIFLPDYSNTEVPSLYKQFSGVSYVNSFREMLLICNFQTPFRVYSPSEDSVVSLLLGYDSEKYAKQNGVYVPLLEAVSIEFMNTQNVDLLFSLEVGSDSDQSFALENVILFTEPITCNYIGGGMTLLNMITI